MAGYFKEIKHDRFQKMGFGSFTVLDREIFQFNFFCYIIFVFTVSWFSNKII